jgi:NADH dehydrogenase
MVRLISQTLGRNPSLLHVPPRVALAAAQFLSFFVGDMLLTPEEVDGLTAGLLVSNEPPRCKTHLSDWLEENKEKVGKNYASELKRHY